MTKTEGSGSRIRIRIHWSEAWIRGSGSGSTPKMSWIRNTGRNLGFSYFFLLVDPWIPKPWIRIRINLAFNAGSGSALKPVRIHNNAYANLKKTLLLYKYRINLLSQNTVPYSFEKLSEELCVVRSLGPGRFQMTQQQVCDDCPNVK
jgi:hypothetical protein